MTTTERGGTTQATGEHPPVVQDYRRPASPPGGRGRGGIGGILGGQGTYGAAIGELLLRRWRERAFVAGGAGVAGVLLFDFKVGVSIAVVVAIVDTLLRARSAPSGGATTGGTGLKLTKAMRKTERQLRGFERQGWQVLHNRSIPGTPNRIDHLLIGPTGVYVVDSEKWDRRLAVRAMSHRKLFHGPFNMHERLDEARFEARQASRLIAAELGDDVEVQPSLAIYGPSVPWKVLNVRDVDVYSGGQARRYLRRRPKVLNSTQIERISRAAEKALPIMH
jgi:hypothetical protein